MIDIEREREELIRFFGVSSDEFAAIDRVTVLHWRARLMDFLQAARAERAEAAQPEWPKLDKPAKVGNGRFGVGVSARLVVEAAQRLHEREVPPEQEAAIRQAISEGKFFADNGADIEARFAEDTEHLNCPACGGSGHVDDAKAKYARAEAAQRVPLTAESVRQIIAALESAQNGLAWYRDRCQEAVDGSDDEADTEIALALCAARDGLTATEPKGEQA